MNDPNCIFCKIVAGEIPATAVYEDEHILAFKDNQPQAPVHVLVIPKEHHENIGDGVGKELMGHLFTKVPEIASDLGLSEDGYRVITNVGENAGQTVFHLHVHVIGGCRMLPKMVECD